MDEAARERLERQHRPNLFEDCRQCGEQSMKIATHECDVIRRTLYQATLIPAYEPNEEMVKSIEGALLGVFIKHRMVVSSNQLREFALAVEPFTGGPEA